MRLGLTSEGLVVSIRLRSLSALEDKDRSADGDLVAVPQARGRCGSAVDQYRIGAVLVFDFAVIADRAKGGVQVGDERIIEEINVAARRCAELHGVFEEQEFLAGQRS